MRKLTSNGFAHWILPVLVVVAIGAIGTYLLTRSKAATGPGVIYANDADGVYSINPDGTNKQRLPGLSGYQLVAVSNDGTELALEQNNNIYVSGNSGAGLTKVTQFSSDTSTLPYSGVTDDVSFFPDGKSLAFVKYTNSVDPSNSSNSIYSSTVYKVSTDGSSQTVLTPGKQADEMSLSANGTKLIYREHNNGNTLGYNLLDLSSGTTSRLSFPTDEGLGGNNTHHIFWSSDESTITYLAEPQSGTHACVIHQFTFSTSAVKQIYMSPDDFDCDYLGKSPDDTKWSFVMTPWTSDGSGGGSSDPANGNVYTVPIEGTNETVVPNTPGSFTAVFGSSPSTVTTATLTSNGLWILSDGATRTTDHGRDVLSLRRYASAQASTKRMTKLANFVQSNFGKKAQLCITARQTSTGPLVLTFHDLTAGKFDTQFTFQPDYATKCTTFVIESKSAYDSAMASRYSEPGFTLQVSPRTSTTTRAFVEKVDLKLL